MNSMYISLVYLTSVLPVTATTVTFTEVTASAGVDYFHGGGPTIFFMGGGAAVGDFDSDGLPDLYGLCGASGPNQLFRNSGDGTFEEIGLSAEVDVSDAGGSGPLFVDIDGDSHLDILIGGLDFSPTYLFRNRGDGTFENRTFASGLPAFARTYGSAFGDFDRDGDLDVFIAQWSNVPTTVLWRNMGNFTFVPATEALMGDANDFLTWTFTPNFTDLDNDGWLDLVVASDFDNSQVLMNRGGTFERVTDDAVIIDQNGMGAAVGDFDNDGIFDWFVTAIRAEGSDTIGNRLYKGLGNGTFSDVTEQAGVAEGFWGWGACFADFNNDGWLDIFHTNGFVHNPFEDDPSRLFINQGDGTFEESAAAYGLDDRDQGRGVACFDYDRDGDIDLFVANNSGPSRLYRNDGGNAGHFLSVALRGEAPNSRGVGARIEVQQAAQSWVSEIRAGNNFVSQNGDEAHFGLGASTQATTLHIRWPDGKESSIGGVAVDQHLIVDAATVLSDSFETGTLDVWSLAVP